MQAPQRIGRFEDLSFIAEGGQATVYRGRDTETGETVAIKVLHSGSAIAPEHVDQFRFEAESVAEISHPNVVKLLGGDLDSNTKYLAFEFIEGNLKKTLAEDSPFSPERAAWIAYQVALGLEAAHNTGVIHRDIKPSNILLTEDETARLIDFGIAIGVDARTLAQANAMVGTAMYMSGEQAEPGVFGEQTELGGQSDIYSLGVVLFEMVIGHVPFTAGSPIGIAKMHIEAPIPNVRELNPDVPEWLVLIIERCLQKRPEDRFQTAAELAAELAEHIPDLALRHDQLIQLEVTDRTSTQSDGTTSIWFDSTRRQPRRRRWRWLVGATLGLITIASVSVAAVLLAIYGDSDRPGDIGVPPADVPGFPVPPAQPPQGNTDPIQVALVNRDGQTTLAVLPPETVDQLPIRRLEISADSQVVDGSLVIRGITSPESEGVPELADSHVNRYLVMEVNGVEDASDLPSVVEFELATAWLNTERLNTDDIHLFKYLIQGEFAEWIKLKTTVIVETADTVRFSAVVPGFSVFAVGSSSADLRSTPSPPTSTPTRVPNPTSTTPTTFPQTYVSDMYGFSFDVPGRWTLEELSPEFVSATDPQTNASILVEVDPDTSDFGDDEIWASYWFFAGRSTIDQSGYELVDTEQTVREDGASVWFFEELIFSPKERLTVRRSESFLYNRGFGTRIYFTAPDVAWND